VTSVVAVGDQAVRRWAASGMMALTGDGDGPPRASMAGVATVADELAAQWAAAGSWLGQAVEVDGPAVLAQRAAWAGLRRQGSVSAGGVARFEQAADGWIVVNLPRTEDVAMLPALLGENVDPGDWAAIRVGLAHRPTDELTERAAQLGIAVARPGEYPPVNQPVQVLAEGRPVTAENDRRPLVVDLSSLWAGPLAGSLLAAAGARVIKVEGLGRWDGARRGPVGFFDRLNAGKEMALVDFAQGDPLLARLVASADLVIEGSRPRVMERLGIDPEVVAAEHGTSWLSITGHGRVDAPMRVGFGDDAAVAGGLWWHHGDHVGFLGDAIADPLTGLVAAIAGAKALAGHRGRVLDVPLARVSSWVAGRTSVDDEAEVVRSGDDWVVRVADRWEPVAQPHPSEVHGRAAEAGADTEALRDEFGPR